MNVLIKNITLISMSSNREKIEYNIDVEIEDGVIKKIGKGISSRGYVIDGTGKVLLPGFINCHNHLPMSLFRETVDGYSLQDWLEKFIWPNEKKLTKEDIYYATLLSCIEMIESGITTINDHYFFVDEIIKACNEIGIDDVYTRYLIDEDGKGLERFEELKELIERNKNEKFTLGIHGLYTNSEEFIKMLTDYARSNNLMIHMHFCENSNEVEEIKRKYNVHNPSEVLEKYFKDLKCILAHGVKLSDYDIDVLKNMDATIVHCPITNLKLGSGIADIVKLLENGINVALGTDGQGSGSNSDMFEIMRVAGLLQKGINEDPTLMDAYELLKMATVNGAKALGRDDIGIIEEGKRANVFILNYNDTNMMPINNLISDIVYNADSDNVETVIINGNIVMENHRFLNIDKDLIFRKCNEIANKLFE